MKNIGKPASKQDAQREPQGVIKYPSSTFGYLRGPGLWRGFLKAKPFTTKPDADQFALPFASKLENSDFEQSSANTLVVLRGGHMYLFFVVCVFFCCSGVALVASQ